MTGPASLAMYDTLSVRDATDALWGAIRSALRARGVAAPDTLTRNRADAEIWTDPDLVLAQTCGLPFVTGMTGRSVLLGAADYRLDGCPSGYYRSIIITRKDHPATRLDAFANASYAFNATNSQSGFACLHQHCKQHAPGALGKGLSTGAHIASIAAVASAKADLAAIDAVTFRLAKADGMTEGVREIARTAPTPGLPFITAPKHDVARMQDAIEDGIERLAPHHKSRLGLNGFVRFTPDDYTSQIHPVPTPS